MSGARKAAMKGGRFTPKGTVAPTKKDAAKSKGPADANDAAKLPAYAQTGRYTPPTQRTEETVTLAETKPWVVPLMILMLVLGLLLIVNYYVGVLPGGRSGWYLLGGLAAITGGFAVATQLK
jgi:Cell division protein CrgA